MKTYTKNGYSITMGDSEVKRTDIKKAFDFMLYLYENIEATSSELEPILNSNESMSNYACTITNCIFNDGYQDFVLYEEAWKSNRLKFGLMPV